jgi:hypothetical protein
MSKQRQFDDAAAFVEPRFIGVMLSDIDRERVGRPTPAPSDAVLLIGGASPRARSRTKAEARHVR